MTTTTVDTVDTVDDRTTAATRRVAETWFDAVGRGDLAAATAFLDPDVEFVNYAPVPGFNTAMPWIGTSRGPAEVAASFGVFTATCEVLLEEVVALVVDGDTACGIVHERSRARATGEEFEIEFVQRLRVRDGRIVSWKSYTDPSPILRALGASPQPGVTA